jgi:RimJ/RimL family protein N-acetyltransferase
MPEHAAQKPIVNIVGGRIALGPLRHDLIPHYNRWQNDFEVQRTFGDLPKGVTIEETTSWYEEEAKATSAFWFTIYEVGTWRPIGRTDLFEVDWRSGTARFGMLIGEGDCRGKGYGTETTRLMLDYAFTALGLQTILLDVDEYNYAGRRAYEKAGFRECGRWRGASPMLGRRWDRILMDCVAIEFESPLLERVFAPAFGEHLRLEAVKGPGSCARRPQRSLGFESTPGLLVYPIAVGFGFSVGRRG